MEGNIIKKTILAFGDSNTWGWNPANDLVGPLLRWSDEVRWTGVAQGILGDDYKILNEGLNGRTTVWDDPIEEYRCGKDQIIPAMDIAAPIDLMIIFVGSNDLKNRYRVTAEDIGNSVGLLVDKAIFQVGAFGAGGTKILVIAPPALGDLSSSIFGEMFRGNEEKSERMGACIEAVAASRGVEFLDAGKFIKSSDKDGLHLEADQHKILGEVVAEKIKDILG